MASQDVGGQPVQPGLSHMGQQGRENDPENSVGPEDAPLGQPNGLDPGLAVPLSPRQPFLNFYP